MAAGAFLGGLAYTVLGFAQFVFYLRRAVGESKRSARVWWLSTYFFNLVPVGVAIAVFVQDPYAAPALAAVWFAGLCTLAVVAYASELRRA